METRRQAHSVYRCEYHIVIIPRYRYKILRKGVREYLGKKLEEVRKEYPEIEYREKSIRPDHVHMIISFPPKWSIAKVVQIIKANTGKAMRDKYEYIRRRYYGRGGMWSVGYFASTVGLDEKMIRRYVRYQEEEDLGQAKLALV